MFLGREGLSQNTLETSIIELSFFFLGGGRGTLNHYLIGQKNPWYEIAKKSYRTDVILHLGDQVYNKGEDNDKTCQLFGEEYEAMEDSEKKLMKKRGRALLAKKYRQTWNKKATRSCLQQGCHLMIWSDNDVANDFTTMKDQNGEQAYPPAFLQVGIEMYRDYQRLLWDTSLTSGYVY